MSVSCERGARRLRVLILGGSSEASSLARQLAGHSQIEATLSLAGRTIAPARSDLPVRIGGFGGVPGLVMTLRRDGFDVLIDATHPFAARMSANALEASSEAGIPLIRLGRPPWRPQPGDLWSEVPDVSAAVAALGTAPRHVFVTVGRLQLAAFREAPQHHYLVRTIDPVGTDHGLPNADFIEARGPFLVADEERLMKTHRIDMLVTKNSGGTASQAKLEAARALGIPVILIARPAQEEGTLGDVTAIVANLEAHVARREV